MVRLERMAERHLERTLGWLASSPGLRDQIDSLETPSEAGHAQYWRRKWQDTSREDYAIVAGDAGHVGNCGLMAIDGRRKKAELWIYVGETRGKRIGSQALDGLLRRAFLELGLQRVSIRVIETNLRALTFYMQAGFRIEGRARSDTIQNGISLDSILLSILADEYASRGRAHRPHGET